MRTIIYTIYDRKEKKRVYTNCDILKVKEEMKKLNDERYEIRHTWRSF